MKTTIFDRMESIEITSRLARVAKNILPTAEAEEGWYSRILKKCEPKFLRNVEMRQRSIDASEKKWVKG